MRRPSRRVRSPLALCGLAGLAGSWLVLAIAPGCGNDTCVILNTSVASLEWTFTFAVTGSESIGALRADIVVQACNGICDCDHDCGCGTGCDCRAGFSGEHTELDCEPLVDATYRGSLDDEGTAHVELVAEEAIVAPAEILKCQYSSATEPSPSDFRIVVNEASGLVSERLAESPSIVVASIARAADGDATRHR